MYRSLYCSIGILISFFFGFNFIVRIVLAFTVCLRFKIVVFLSNLVLCTKNCLKTLKIVFSNLNFLNRISLSWRQEFKMAANIQYDAKNNIMLLSTPTGKVHNNFFNQIGSSYYKYLLSNFICVY